MSYAPGQQQEVRLHHPIAAKKGQNRPSPIILGAPTSSSGRTLFDLAIDSKLRGCDLVKLRIADVTSGGSDSQSRNGHPTEDRQAHAIEIMTEARKSLTIWLERRGGSIWVFTFPSRIDYLAT